MNKNRLSWSKRDLCWRLRRGDRGENIAFVAESPGHGFFAQGLHRGAPYFSTRKNPVPTIQEAKAQAEAWAVECGF